MNSSTAAVMSAKSELGNATRSRDLDRIHRARLAYNAAKLERTVREAVAEAPPLPRAERERIAALLLEGGGSE